MRLVESTDHNSHKIICSKGVKHVRSVTSGETEINVTLIVAVNAIGNHISPMLIFPRELFKNHMLSLLLQLQLEVQSQHVRQITISFLTT
jgi:hypothetical protein